METFNEFNKLYQLIIVTIASVSTMVLLNYLQDKIRGKSFLIIVIIIMVSAGLTITNYFVENLIDNSSSVRKWIDCDNFIEGYYYDVTVKGSKTDHLALLQIVYENKNYQVYGESFDENGKHLSTFKSIQSIYSDRNLYFTWEAHQTRPLQGVDHLQFGIPPKSYSGFYINYQDTLEYSPIKGLKIEDELLQKYRNFETMEDKSKFALDMIHGNNKISIKKK